jgi:DNA-binding CsgD family transcriptional regulator
MAQPYSTFRWTSTRRPSEERNFHTARLATSGSLGLTTAETAKMLCCSHETARSHLKSAYRRLDIACRLELVEPAAEWERWTQLSL